MKVEQTKKRIEFIDLAKGVCILLVIADHCGALPPLPGFEVVQMPLFFILSGLFFKEYGCFANFLIQKINRILIPFLFFYLLGYVAFYLIQMIAPQLLITEARGIFDLFDNRQFFNGPIWFLLALFWLNVILYGIVKSVQNDIARVITVCLLGFIGWYSGNVLHVFVPLFLDVALTALPFFAFGYYLKRTEILYPNKYDKYNILFAVISWGIAFALAKISHFRLSMHYNVLQGWFTYIIAIASVFSILFLCKAIKRLPLISYMGRYTLVLLCTHHLIYRPVRVIVERGGVDGSILSFMVTLITVLLSTALIPLCIKYIPWFAAQKDLIKMPSKYWRCKQH